MKTELKRAIENMKKYNSGNMYQECFGFEPEVEYDALVVAPGWKPTIPVSFAGLILAIGSHY